MFKWLVEKYQEWQFERAFQKRKKEIMKVDQTFNGPCTSFEVETNYVV